MPTIESVGHAGPEKLTNALSWEYGAINTGLDLRQAIMYSQHLRPVDINIHADMSENTMHLVFKTNPNRYDRKRKDVALITSRIESETSRAGGNRVEFVVSGYFAEIQKTKEGFLTVTIRTTMPVEQVKIITDRLHQPYVPTEENRYEKVLDFRPPAPRRLPAA